MKIYSNWLLPPLLFLLIQLHTIFAAATDEFLGFVSTISGSTPITVSYPSTASYADISTVTTPLNWFPTTGGYCEFQTYSGEINRKLYNARSAIHGDYNDNNYYYVFRFHFIWAFKFQDSQYATDFQALANPMAFITDTFGPVMSGFSGKVNLEEGSFIIEYDLEFDGGKFNISPQVIPLSLQTNIFCLQDYVAFSWVIPEQDGISNRYLLYGESVTDLANQVVLENLETVQNLPVFISNLSIECMNFNLRNKCYLEKYDNAPSAYTTKILETDGSTQTEIVSFYLLSDYIGNNYIETTTKPYLIPQPLTTSNWWYDKYVTEIFSFYATTDEEGDLATGTSTILQTVPNNKITYLIENGISKTELISYYPTTNDVNEFATATTTIPLTIPSPYTTISTSSDNIVANVISFFPTYDGIGRFVTGTATIHQFPPRDYVTSFVFDDGRTQTERIIYALTTNNVGELSTVTSIITESIPEAYTTTRVLEDGNSVTEFISFFPMICGYGNEFCTGATTSTKYTAVPDAYTETQVFHDGRTVTEIVSFFPTTDDMGEFSTGIFFSYLTVPNAYVTEREIGGGTFETEIVSFIPTTNDVGEFATATTTNTKTVPDPYTTRIVLNDGRTVTGVVSLLLTPIGVGDLGTGTTTITETVPDAFTTTQIFNERLALTEVISFYPTTDLYGAFATGSTTSFQTVPFAYTTTLALDNGNFMTEVLSFFPTTDNSGDFATGTTTSIQTLPAAYTTTVALEAGGSITEVVSFKPTTDRFGDFATHTTTILETVPDAYTTVLILDYDSYLTEVISFFGTTDDLGSFVTGTRTSVQTVPSPFTTTLAIEDGSYMTAIVSFFGTTDEVGELATGTTTIYETVPEAYTTTVGFRDGSFDTEIVSFFKTIDDNGNFDTGTTTTTIYGDIPDAFTTTLVLDDGSFVTKVVSFFSTTDDVGDFATGTTVVGLSSSASMTPMSKPTITGYFSDKGPSFEILIPGTLSPWTALFVKGDSNNETIIEKVSYLVDGSEFNAIIDTNSSGYSLFEAANLNSTLSFASIVIQELLVTGQSVYIHHAYVVIEGVSDSGLKQKRELSSYELEYTLSQTVSDPYSATHVTDEGSTKTDLNSYSTTKDSTGSSYASSMKVSLTVPSAIATTYVDIYSITQTGIVSYYPTVNSHGEFSTGEMTIIETVPVAYTTAELDTFGNIVIEVVSFYLTTSSQGHYVTVTTTISESAILTTSTTSQGDVATSLFSLDPAVDSSGYVSNTTTNAETEISGVATASSPVESVISSASRVLLPPSSIVVSASSGVASFMSSTDSQDSSASSFASTVDTASVASITTSTHGNGNSMIVVESFFSSTNSYSELSTTMNVETNSFTAYFNSTSSAESHSAEFSTSNGSQLKSSSSTLVPTGLSASDTVSANGSKDALTFDSISSSDTRIMTRTLISTAIFTNTDGSVVTPVVTYCPLIHSEGSTFGNLTLGSASSSVIEEISETSTIIAIVVKTDGSVTTETTTYCPLTNSAGSTIGTLIITVPTTNTQNTTSIKSNDIFKSGNATLKISTDYLGYTILPSSTTSNSSPIFKVSTGADINDHSTMEDTVVVATTSTEVLLSAPTSTINYSADSNNILSNDSIVSETISIVNSGSITTQSRITTFTISPESDETATVNEVDAAKGSGVLLINDTTFSLVCFFLLWMI